MDKKMLNKLQEIKEILFVLSTIELYRAGVNQDGIAKALKTSKTTINDLLKNIKIDKKRG